MGSAANPVAVTAASHPKKIYSRAIGAVNLGKIVDIAIRNPPFTGDKLFAVSAGELYSALACAADFAVFDQIAVTVTPDPAPADFLNIQSSEGHSRSRRYNGVPCGISKCQI